MRALPQRGLADAAAVAAAAAGLLLACPPINFWPLAWVAPAPLLARLARTAPARSLALGGAWGILFFTGTLYWAHAVMVRFGGLPWWLAAGPLALLVLYCAAYWAAFAWGVAAGARRWGAAALWLAPVLWTALELVRSRVLWGGFPWALVGLTQQSFLPALQAAAWGGVYAVGTLLVLAWAWLAWLAGGAAAFGGAAGGALHATAPGAAPGGGRRARVRLILAAAGVAAAASQWAAGAARVRRLEAVPSDLRLACVQVNVPQEVKWSAALSQEILEAHRVMTLQAASAGATVAVWPESSLPFISGRPVPGAPTIEAWVGERARESGVDILWGGTAVIAGDEEAGARNSAYLTRADGSTPTRYDKMRLVPFGEYVPLGALLGWVAPLVQEVGDFKPGRAPVVHAAGRARLGAIICYEILFPHLVRSVAAGGADLIVNLTNDAWYGRTIMPHLHLAAAPLRAVESGMAVVRAANTGISALVLPSGRIAAASDLDERQVLVGQVPSRPLDTFYRRRGDVWAGACAIMAAAYLVALAATPRRRTRAPAHNAEEPPT